MRRLRLSVKRKLIGAIVLGCIAASLLTYAVLLAYELHSFRKDTARNLSVIAGLIASNSSAALMYDDEALARENLAALRSEPDITAAALFDEHGNLFATYPANAPPSLFPPKPGPDGMKFHDDRLTLYSPVVQLKQHAGTLFLESDLGEMYGRFRVYGVVLLLILGASVAVSLLLSNFFQRRISGPILELAKMARIISEQKNYSIRAHPSGEDELGDLNRAFNAMLDQIQASHAEVEKARDEALAASRTKDDFLAALSHELRTPLNPVLLLASDAATQADLPAKVRADFDVIRKNVELEARLIDDLLDLTRITRGKLVLNRSLLDPRRVLQDAMEIVKADAHEKHIHLSLAVGHGRPLVMADPTRLQQIFWNVLKNAIKFTPKRGRVAVDLRTDPEAGRVLITVEDSGIGLTAEESSRIFKVFSQGEHAEGGSHRFGGLGLGLAISRTLAELHSGTIRASSRGRDNGATFVIDLPLAPDQAHPPRTPEPRDVAAPTAARTAGHVLRILLVEDHAATRNALARMLKRRGYEVLTAASLAEARTRASEGEIDALISDIGLPDGNGYDLMVELSARHPIKGIAFTGYGAENDIQKSRESGFAAHLTKPIHVKMLDEALALVFPKEGS